MLGIDLADLPDLVLALFPLVATLVALLVSILVVSQWRDLRRLRRWREANPDYPKNDIAASETILDRAEGELEELLAEPAAVIEVAAAIEHVAPPTSDALEQLPSHTGEFPITAAHRVTTERPALERLTMERAALAPHPGWHRFLRWLYRPRLLIALGLISIVVAAGAVIGVDRLITPSEDAGVVEVAPGAEDDAGAISVAVLNGAPDADELGERVADDIESNGFELALPPGQAGKAYQQTVIMYAEGKHSEALRVADALGVEAVQSLDRRTERLVGSVDVVVIAGQDRAG